MRYRTWQNLTIEDVEGVEFGQSFGDVPTIKPGKNFGLFGGLLSKLPPEVRRAGRDILQTTRRNLPIGKSYRWKSISTIFIINKGDI